MLLALPPDAFSIAYEPGRDLLAGTWPRPLSMVQLAASYEKMLVAARAHAQCRFWLLDIRQRNWHSAEFGHWFTTDFAPRAAAALGRPLFIAYLVAGGQRPLIESALTDELLRQAAKVNCFPFYFESALDGQAWLLDQHDAEPAARRRPGYVAAH